MSTDIVKQLVRENDQAQQQAQQLLSLIGVLALQHGTSDNNGATEYRLTKTKISKIQDQQVDVRSLKTGGVVITVRKPEEE